MASLQETAVDVVRRIQTAGYEALWAGGCVRDILMKLSPKDYDIATDARPEAVMALFPSAKVTGKAFGVVRVTHNDFCFEIATFRTDVSYTDGRHPVRVVFCDPRTDALRRDFTINAMFFDPVSERLYDYVDGRKDIDSRLIRCVGDPQERIVEDHLRMLRAVRFAATLGFALEERTREAIIEHASLVKRISAERIREEATRILLEAREAGKALALLEDLGLLSPILPEVSRMKGQEQPSEFHPEGDVFQHTVLMLNLMKHKDPILAFSILLHDVGKPPCARQDGERIRFDGHARESAIIAENILKRWRFSREAASQIVACIENHMQFMHVREMRQATLRRLVGRPTFNTELELHRLDCLASHGRLDNYNFLLAFRDTLCAEPALPEPWITGRDVMDLGVHEGPAVGRWRKTAYDAQLEGRFSDKKRLKAWLREQIKNAS